MRRCIAGWVAVTAALTALLDAPTATAGPRSMDPVDDGVHIVGDSITNAAHRTVLADRPAYWTVDAVDGRRVVALGAAFVPRTDAYEVATTHMFRVNRETRMRTVVLALGTNSASRTLTIAESARLYRAAIERFRRLALWKPGPRRVVLVTPFTTIRPGDVDDNGQPYPVKNLAGRAEVNAQAIRRVAASQSGVCVMPWRGVISRRPELLYDGIHPDQEGLRLWRSLLFRTIRDCRT